MGTTTQNFYTRIFFGLLCMSAFAAWSWSWSEGSIFFLTLGMGGGFLFTILLLASEPLFAKIRVQRLALLVLGLFLGYAAQEILWWVISLSLTSSTLQPSLQSLLHLVILLTSLFAGVIATNRASKEICCILPFVRLKPVETTTREFLLDGSILADPRIIDLAASGLLGDSLALPRFVLKELHELADSADDTHRNKSRRALETIKKLESIPSLTLRYVDTDFPEVKDPVLRILRVAKFLNAYLLTSDINRVQQLAADGVKIVNIHLLANALKPLMQTGEIIEIKIQRYGKEPRQGVGYLEDGTMVVVNGGGDFIGEIVKAQVLSVKHTTSGRMIFCNALEAEALRTEMTSVMDMKKEPLSSVHRDYFLI